MRYRNAAMDLEKISLAELRSVEKENFMAIAEFGHRSKVEARSALEEHVRTLGVSLAELMGVKVRITRSGAGAAKYQHSEDPAITWSGQGRKPRWFANAIEEGGAPELMAVWALNLYKAAMVSWCWLGTLEQLLLVPVVKTRREPEFQHGRHHPASVNNRVSKKLPSTICKSVSASILRQLTL